MGRWAPGLTAKGRLAFKSIYLGGKKTFFSLITGEEQLPEAFQRLRAQLTVAILLLRRIRVSIQNTPRVFPVKTFFMSNKSPGL